MANTHPGLIAIVIIMAAVTSSCAGWQSNSPTCLAGAALDSGGKCRAQSAPEHYFPFREGTKVEVTQGFHGYASHRKDLAFAVDFACEEGTPITASRRGVVWSTRDDSNTGCSDSKCVDDANYIILDHGDGTYSSYFHLQYKGVIVEPGEQVCAGQAIGICGNTGFSTGSHLHFAVSNAQGATIPVAFAEVRHRWSPVVLPQEVYRSNNRRRAPCANTEYSRLERDAFAHRGIRLWRSIPAVIDGDGERRVRLQGTYVGRLSHVAVHRRAVGSTDWHEQCVSLDNGRFDFEVDWSAERFGPGFYFLMITGSDEDCQAPGWAWSYQVRVDSSGLE